MNPFLALRRRLASNILLTFEPASQLVSELVLLRCRLFHRLVDDDEPDLVVCLLTLRGNVFHFQSRDGPDWAQVESSRVEWDEQEAMKIKF